MLTASLFAACTSDSSETDGQQVLFEVGAALPSFTVEQPSASVTRSWTPPTGYYSYDDINGQFEGQQSLLHTSIETFFTRNGAAAQQGTFYYNEGSSSWKLSMPIATGGNYYLYGFLPKDEAATSSIAPNPNFSDGAVLSLNGLSTVTPRDVCIIVGAKDGLSTTDDNGLITGQFLVNAKATNGSNHNYIYLLFDHLYAAMGLRFTIDAAYNDLRTIKLRKLEVKAIADNDGTPIKAKQNAVVTLQANDSGTSPLVGEIAFTPDLTSADAEMEPLYEGEVVLSTAVPVTFMGSFIPGSTNYFSVRTTYDVYDKAGNLLRQHCQAENTIALRDIFGLSNILRGHMYMITFRVQPTYLYMLSDPDLDSPTMRIEN